MPQNGFHGIAGLAVAKWVTPRAPVAVAETFAASVVLGAMLPDVDAYPAAVAFLLGRSDLTYSIHRTFTHSLLALLMVSGLGVVLRRQSQAAAWACFGLALGMLTHLLLDTFFWFAPLDLFWPLSHLPSGAPVLPVLDLWAAARPLPALFNNIREAGELGAFALYLMVLRRVTQRDPAPVKEAAGLARWERWAWAGFGVALAGAFVLPHALQQVLVFAPWLLAFAPYCWGKTLRLRSALARWCLASK